MALTVKHLPAMQETRVRSLGWEDPLEKESLGEKLQAGEIISSPVPWNVLCVPSHWTHSSFPPDQQLSFLRTRTP